MKEWELDENEIFDATLGIPACCGNPAIDVPHHKGAAHKIGKAYQKKLVEWLREKGARFMTEVEGHKGFYELDWVIFEELLDDLGVK